MKPMQMIVLGIAVVAAIALAFMARSLLTPPPAAPILPANAPIQTIPTVDVLVANAPVPMGSSLTEERLAWEQWPSSSLRESFITRDEEPEALEKYAKQIARSSFFEGEPIRAAKLVESESGYLSAILPRGKRAVSVRIQEETSAGGFILPNDRVDVIMVYQDDDRNWLSNKVLTNVRVLAIDQLIEDKEGEKFKVGDTATLELDDNQVETLAVAKSIAKGNLTLALRSVADSSKDLSGANAIDQDTTSSTIKLIRGGDTKEIRTDK